MTEKPKSTRKGWAGAAEKIGAEQMQKQPKPLVDRVRDSEARSIEAGAMRIPGGLLKPDVAKALNELLEEGYEESKTAVISKAILAARKRLKK